MASISSQWRTQEKDCTIYDYQVLIIFAVLIAQFGILHKLCPILLNPGYTTLENENFILDENSTHDPCSTREKGIFFYIFSSRCVHNFHIFCDNLATLLMRLLESCRPTDIILRNLKYIYLLFASAALNCM